MNWSWASFGLGFAVGIPVGALVFIFSSGIQAFVHAGG